MRDQLQHLLKAAEQPNVKIQVLPFEVGAHPGMISSFTIIKFPDPVDPDVVYIEGRTGDVYVEGKDVHPFTLDCDDLQAAALSPSESLQMIGRIAGETA